MCVGVRLRKQKKEPDQDRAVYTIVPMSVDAILTIRLGHAQFLGEKVFGVVPYRAGFLGFASSPKNSRSDHFGLRMKPFRAPISCATSSHLTCVRILYFCDASLIRVKSWPRIMLRFQ